MCKKPFFYTYFTLIYATLSSMHLFLLYSFREMPSDISVQRDHCGRVGDWVAGCFSGRETSKPHTQTAGLMDSMFGGVSALLPNWAYNGTFCFQSNRITYNWE